jgi:Saxitoxin biosynthesis operon protein SxtJ
LTDAAPKAPVATPRDLRNFGFTFGVIAAIVSAFLFWRARTSPAQGFLIASLLFFAVGALVPGLLRPAFGPWMKFAEILGYINTRILLGLFYYVGMTPTGLLMRLAGKDPMTRTFKQKDARTYWSKPTPHVDGRRHFDRQF